MSNNTSLEALTGDDFGVVTQLAGEIWRSHYTPIIGKIQVEYMLERRYTHDTLHAYLNSAVRWFDLLRVCELPVGYCSYSLAAPGEMKLEQLYVLQEFRGKGFGRDMLLRVEAKAAAAEIRLVKLQVNKSNHQAISFYRKCGFAVLEESVVDIGDGFVMDDYVMGKVIGEAAVF